MKNFIVSKILCTVLAVCLIMAALAGCGNHQTAATNDAGNGDGAAQTANDTAPNNTDTPKASGSGKVGFLLADLTQEFFAYYGNSVKAALEAEGYSVTLASYNGEAAKAIEQIETFTSQGVEAILMMGATPDLADALKAARAQGVKVLLAGNEVEDGFDVCLLADNKQMGELIGQMGADHWNANLKDDPNAEVLSLEVNYMGQDMANRSKAMSTMFKEQTGIADDKFHVIEFTIEGGDTTGQTLLENSLTKYPNTKLVITYSDVTSLTALNILKAGGATGEEYGIFGSDATVQALIEIADPNSIYRGTVSMGDIVSQTTENALKLLRDEFPTLPFRNEGPGVPVTAENVMYFLPPTD